MSEPHVVRLVLPRRPHVELEAGQAVETLGLDAGFSRDTLAVVRLAVVEACLNAMEHGGGPVTVRLRGDNHSRPCLVIEVEDHGRGFDPERAPRNSSSRVLGSTSKRGWGLTLIRELMDEVNQSTAMGTTLFVHRQPANAREYAGPGLIVRPFDPDDDQTFSGSLLLLTTRSNVDLKHYPEAPELFSVEQDGAVFCLVRQIP